MGGGSGHTVANIVYLLIISHFLEYSVCQRQGKCQYEGGSRCSSGMTEIFRDDISPSRQLRYCCTLGSTSEKLGLRKQVDCQLTECHTSSGTNLCSTLNPRIVSGRPLIYEEVLRESCSGSTNSSSIALCCVERSKQSSLVSRLGAEIHEFPHVVKVKPGAGTCGGTIYNKRYIITAAHCVVSQGQVKPISGMKVLVGTNIGDFDSTERVYSVEKVIPHERYSRLWTQPEFGRGGNSRSRLFNDIALLRVNRDIKFGPSVKALEIAPRSFNASQYADHAVIVGWGITNTLQLSAHLQKANFLIRSDQSCLLGSRYQAPRYYGYGGLTQGIICFGGILHGRWSPITGQGDSGGPAICKGHDGRAVLCGVASFGVDGEPCLKYQDEQYCRPSAYVEVSHYRDWIEKQAGRQDASTLHRPFLYGEDVSKSQYPHQVHVTSTTGKSCGGTLISKNAVVTAAQCVSRGNGSIHGNLKVTVGQVDLKHPKDGEVYEVVKVAVLDGFKKLGRAPNMNRSRIIYMDNFHQNDLALLKIKGKVILAEYPRLPLPMEKLSRDAFELSFPRNLKRGGTLKRREFRILERDECEKRMNRMSRRFQARRKIDRNFLCGVEKFSGGSLCDRELGGGLICNSADTLNVSKKGDVLCGVQIFRLCESSVPNGFMDMRKFKDWIERSM